MGAHLFPMLHEYERTLNGDNCPDRRALLISSFCEFTSRFEVPLILRRLRVALVRRAIRESFAAIELLRWGCGDGGRY